MGFWFLLAFGFVMDFTIINSVVCNGIAMAEAFFCI